MPDETSNRGPLSDDAGNASNRAAGGEPAAPIESVLGDLGRGDGTDTAPQTSGAPSAEAVVPPALQERLDHLDELSDGDVEDLLDDLDGEYLAQGLSGNILGRGPISRAMERAEARLDALEGSMLLARSYNDESRFGAAAERLLHTLQA